MESSAAQGAPDTELIETASESETELAGENVGRRLAAGAVILLYGDLGAGKTAFVRGVVRGLGGPADEVSSPTFTLIQQYQGSQLLLHHVDLYRLAPAEVEELGLDDLIESGGAVAIEWADRWRHRPENAVEISLERLDDDRRRIRVRQ